MKRSTLFLLAAALFAATVAPASAVKYVAVVESDIDAASGASAEMTPAEVRLITAELRREAVKNLPPKRYNVITTETVMAQGSAKLEECAEENCVIALGAKIGADFIVRGTISKFQTLFTLTVDIFETADGNLVASSDPVRSENIRGLLENAAAVCASMYRNFAETQNSIAAAAPPAPEPEPAPAPAPATAPAPEPAPAPAPKSKPQKPPKTPKPKKTAAPEEPFLPKDRKPMTGFSLGSSFNPSDIGHGAAYIGIAHSRPIFDKEKMLSINIECNVLAGSAFNYGVFFGFNAPATVSLQWRFVSFEAGADADILLDGDGETLFNAGFVVGAGVGFSENNSRRYYYRYCGGISYGTHVIGMRWLF